VWKAIDELGRTVAVKIVRESAAVKSSALDHAKALARTSHPNVVSVISLETVEDPDSGERMDAIVMEFLEGVTLETLLQGPKFSVDEARRIGAAIAGAITHIHEQGMEHGDLHETNVMITAGTVKVIDILYTDSLAKLSSRSQAQRLRRDRANLRLTLQHIIAHTDVTTNEATEFGRMVSDKSTASEIGDAFMKVNGAESQTESEQALQRVVVHDAFAQQRLLAALQHQHQARLVDCRHRLRGSIGADQPQPGQGGRVQAVAGRAGQGQRHGALAQSLEVVGRHAGDCANARSVPAGHGALLRRIRQACPSFVLGHWPAGF